MLVAETVIHDPADPAGTLIICRGLPASGKTTSSEAWINESPHTRSRVNRDTIRKAYFNSFWHESIDELAVAEIALSIVTRLAETGRDLIVDDTNLHAGRLQRLFQVGHDANYRIEVRDFDAPLDELLARDQARSKPVGDAAIVNMREQLFHDGQFPTIDLAFAGL